MAFRRIEHLSDLVFRHAVAIPREHQLVSFDGMKGAGKNLCANVAADALGIERLDTHDLQAIRRHARPDLQLPAEREDDPLIKTYLYAANSLVVLEQLRNGGVINRSYISNLEFLLHAPPQI